MCKFDEGEHKQYALTQVEKFSKNRATINIDDDDELTDRDDESDEEVAATPTQLLRGKYLTKLLRIPTGMSMKDHIAELESRKTAREECASAIDVPRRIVEDRFKKLSLGGRPVVVSDYAGEKMYKSLLMH